MIVQARQNLIAALFSKPRPVRPFSWIIWVDASLRDQLYLYVLKPPSPIVRLVSKRSVALAHRAGPLHYSSPNEKTQLTYDLIDIGIEQVPPETPFEICHTLSEVSTVVASWSGSPT